MAISPTAPPYNLWILGEDHRPFMLPELVASLVGDKLGSGMLLVVRHCPRAG